MKKILPCFALTFISLAAQAAPLQWNSVPVPSGSSYGGYDDGSTSRTQMIGNMAYTQQQYTDNQGYQATRNCYSQQVGNQIITRCD